MLISSVISQKNVSVNDLYTFSDQKAYKHASLQTDSEVNEDNEETIPTALLIIALIVLVLLTILVGINILLFWRTRSKKEISLLFWRTRSKKETIQGTSDAENIPTLDDEDEDSTSISSLETTTNMETKEEDTTSQDSVQILFEIEHFSAKGTTSKESETQVETEVRNECLQCYTSFQTKSELATHKEHMHQATTSSTIVNIDAVTENTDLMKVEDRISSLEQILSQHQSTSGTTNMTEVLDSQDRMQRIENILLASGGNSLTSNVIFPENDSNPALQRKNTRRRSQKKRRVVKPVKLVR